MKPVIDYSLVADGLLFTTHGHRCRYLGTPSWEKARWLSDNAGSYGRIDDIEQGSARQTSPPTRVKANISNGSARTVLAPQAKEPTSETSEPKTEAAPLGEMDRGRGRSDDRQRKKENEPARSSKVDRKLSPERMRLVLNSLTESPLLWRAADKAGVHRKTLAYWMKRSRAGDEGYDIEWEGLPWRFHEHCQSAIDEVYQRLLDNLWEIGMGVTFKTDADGNSIMETGGPINPKILLFLLEWFRPEKWGKHPRSEVRREGGVLVVGGSAKRESNTVESNTVASVKARKWKSMSSKIQKAKA